MWLATRGRHAWILLLLARHAPTAPAPAARACALPCRGLLYCMEYLEDNLDEWLGEELQVRAVQSVGGACEGRWGARSAAPPACADHAGRPHCAPQSYGDDDYLIFDCPGQIELYNHLSVFKSFVEHLKQVGAPRAARVCA